MKKVVDKVVEQADVTVHQLSYFEMMKSESA